MTYSYYPKLIKARGKDQMRFELGDTLTDGGANTCALADEEYEGLLEDLKSGKQAWLYAKLAALEAILFKLSYQVNTKIDVLAYDFSKRAEQWQILHDDIKAQILATTSIPAMDAQAMSKPPYFHTGMEVNPMTERKGIANFPFRKMTE